MAQSDLLKQDSVEISLATVAKKLRIKVPHFNNFAFIEGYLKTPIERCMNLSAQSMKTLMYMLPRIWHVNEKVA